MDLEADTAAQIPRSGSTRRIVSFHDFDRTPEKLETIHARLAALDPDIVKLATLATTVHDSLRMLQLVQQARVPTIGFCMGELGIASRLLAGRFGSPLTYAAPDQQGVAPGQLPFAEMKDVYHYDRISPQTAVYGVIGDPLAHSLSPRVHNAAFAALGLDCVYVPLRVPARTWPSSSAMLPRLGCAG